MNIICFDLNNTLCCTKKLVNANDMFGVFLNSDRYKLFKNDAENFMSRKDNNICMRLLAQQKDIRLFIHNGIPYASKLRKGTNFFLKMCRIIADQLYILSNDDFIFINQTLEYHHIQGFFDKVFHKDDLEYFNAIEAGTKDEIVLVDDKDIGSTSIERKMEAMGIDDSYVDNYLIQCSKYLGTKEDLEFIRVLKEIKCKFGLNKIADAIKTAA